MEAHGVTQEVIAAELNVSQRSISHFLTGGSTLTRGAAGEDAGATLSRLVFILKQHSCIDL